MFWEVVGATRERVAHIAMTHPHSDHIGCNVVLEDGQRVQTFPNARYLAPSVDSSTSGRSTTPTSRRRTMRQT